MQHLNISNYTVICDNQTNKVGGGLAIAIHKSLNYKEPIDLKPLNQDYFKCIFLELK